MSYHVFDGEELLAEYSCPECPSQTCECLFYALFKARLIGQSKTTVRNGDGVILSRIRLPKETVDEYWERRNAIDQAYDDGEPKELPI